MTDRVEINWTTPTGTDVALSGHSDAPDFTLELVAITANGRRQFRFKRAGIIDHPVAGRALEGYTTLAGAGEPSNPIVGLTAEAETAVAALLVARATVHAENNVRRAKVREILDEADARHDAIERLRTTGRLDR